MAAHGRETVEVVLDAPSLFTGPRTVGRMHYEPFTCQYYHLDDGEAAAIVSEVRSIAGEWQSRARAMHLPASEIALMRNAFLE